VASAPADTSTAYRKRYDVTDVIGLPKPAPKPHPPILIGGAGMRVLLRLVAQAPTHSSS
jgi:alkanesulfonate monooxygenase SsuD/methylene tetrahydromethanopterin reductase-like flavin-dependent oxidoreductase (luciferase family)